MDLGDYQWLFPKDRSDWKDAPGWYEAVAERMLKWRDDQKLSRHAPLHVLALIVERLRESGRTPPAGLVATVEKSISDAANDRVILADVMRAAGRGDEALAIERELLDAGRLHPDRMAAIVTHVREESGPEKALDLGESLTEYTLHPDLLEVLIQAAKQLGDEPRAARWEKTKAEASVAQRKLDGGEAKGSR